MFPPGKCDSENHLRPSECFMPDKRTVSICEFKAVCWQIFPRRQIYFLKSELIIIKPIHLILYLLLFNLILADISLYLLSKKLALIYNSFIEQELYSKHNRIPILKVLSFGRGQGDTYFSIKNSM